MLQTLLHKVKPYPHLLPVLHQEARMPLHKAGKSITNPGDRLLINRQLGHINNMDALQNKLPLLKVEH